jgi:hypothetical protein
MSSYDDGRDDPLYREEGVGQADELTAVQQPYQQHQPGPHPRPHLGGPQHQGYGQSGYGGQGQFQQPYGYGHPQQYAPWMRPRRQYPIETKPFFLTSEFVGAVLAILGIAITAASSEAFGAWRAWILITAVVVGYMVSRGIAKSGTRSHSADPREQLDLNWGRGDSND